MDASMAYTAAALSGRTTEATARTSASTLTLPCWTLRTVQASPGQGYRDSCGALMNVRPEHLTRGSPTTANGRPRKIICSG
ncbi:hypothetical protein GCM10009610_18600 [Pseudonocardia xinjiangensis]